MFLIARRLLEGSNDMTITKICPMCNATNHMHLTQDELSNYARYLNREDLIQNLFPNLNCFEREFLISGYCLQCQSLLFNRPIPTFPLRLK